MEQSWRSIASWISSTCRIARALVRLAIRIWPRSLVIILLGHSQQEKFVPPLDHTLGPAPEDP